MRKVVRPKNDVVLSNGIFLRQGAVRTIEVSESEWNSIAPAVVDLTVVGVENTSTPMAVTEKAESENDIQHKPRRGKKQTVEK